MSLSNWSSGRLFVVAIAIAIAFGGLLLLWNTMFWMTSIIAPVTSRHDFSDAALPAKVEEIEKTARSLPTMVLLAGTAYIFIGIAFIVGLMSVARLAHEHALARAVARKGQGAWEGTGRPEDWKGPG